MALSANRAVETRLIGNTGYKQQMQVGSGETIYTGAFVAVGNDGYVKALELGDAFFGGIALDDADNSSGIDGALSVDVLIAAVVEHAVEGTVEAPGPNAYAPAVISDIGEIVYCDEDNHLDIKSVSSAVSAGWLQGFSADGTALVRFAWIGQPIA